MSKILDKIQDPRIRIPAATVLGFSLAAILYATSKNPNKTIGRAALHGVGFAVSLNLIGWLIARDGRQIPLLAQSNGDDYTSMGKLSKAAVSVLSELNADKLYKPMKKGGLKVAPLPDNPSVINQEE